MTKFKKIVVVGGSGFIGSYVVEQLLQKSYEVIVADLKCSEYIPESIFVKCDILNPVEVEAAIGENTDVVFNLAGFASLDDSIANPVQSVNLNIIGNLNVLEAARKNKVKHFIYASSAYSVNKKGSFYGISKLSSEKIVEEYQAKFGLNFTILRYGSVYSEREFHNNYIYNLIQSAMEKGEINHHGDGEEIREYIHAADAARLSVDIIENEEFVNQHIILTGVERLRRKELFMMITEILNKDIPVHLNDTGYENHYKTTPYSFTPSLSKKLVANPFIDMGQGILKCIETIYAKQK